MSDPLALSALAFTGIAGLGLTTAAALKGWNGWLELKRLEIRERGRDAVPPSPAARIELADLKARVRKLEAIADGLEY